MMQKSAKTNTLYAFTIAIVVLCGSFVATHRAHAFLGAGDTVFDVPLQAISGSLLGVQTGSKVEQSVETGNSTWERVRDDVLDPIAYNIAASLATKLTSSVVNWANGGFNGAPTFVQDFGQYFQQQGNQVLQSSLGTLQGLSQNNPFARDLALQLINSAQTGNTSNLAQGLQFNLNQIIGPNYQQFYNNPAVGGWQGWNAIAQTQNNPVGSLLYLNQTVKNQTVQLNQNTQLEAIGGGGFLNIKKCTKYAPFTSTNTTPTTYTNNSGNFVTPDSNPGDGSVEFTGGTNAATGNSNSILTNPIDGQSARDCLNWETQTPGSIIKGQLDKSLGVTQDRLSKVDKYKELVSASLTTMITSLANAGLNKLVGSFSQQPIGSIGTASALNGQNSWLNLPNQIVDIDEKQQIQLPNGGYAINKPCPAVQSSTTDICI